MKTLALALALSLLAATSPDEQATWLGQWIGTSVSVSVVFPPCTGGPRVVFGANGIVNLGQHVVIQGGCQ